MCEVRGFEQTKKKQGAKGLINAGFVIFLELARMEGASVLL